MNLNVKEKDINTYNEVFNEKDTSRRSQKAQLATDNFYTLITKFYEKGWGQSFHFAPRFQGETFDESIIRHEHFLAVRLGLQPGEQVLDVGCGVMGPARNICRISGSHITGLTINQHQVERCLELNAASSVGHLLDVRQGDFMDMPFPENSFDKMYAIEALCHAPDLRAVYQQVFDHLKPGGRFCSYEWAMTDKYDPSNPEHVEIKEMIEYGNSICRLSTVREIDEMLAGTDFKILDATDLATSGLGNDVPWYNTLKSGWSIKQIRHTKVSRTVVGTMLRTFEGLRILPKGISNTQKVLLVAADGLVRGGELGIFTPMYLVVVEKPY